MKKRVGKYHGLLKKRAVAGYLFILPFLLGFMLFMVQPLCQSLYMSFCNVEVGAGSFKMTFAGLDNYVNAFTVDPEFNQKLTAELSRMMLYSLAIMVFSFFVALVLNQKFKGRAFVRAIFFLPVILSSGVIINVETNNSLLSSIADSVKGNINSSMDITTGIQTILQTAGIGTMAFEKLFEIINKVYDIAIASGIQIIIFLSGLQTISNSLYESADIEGCTSWEKLWKITFPMVSPLFVVNWVYTLVDFFMRSDNELMDKIRTETVTRLNYGFASSMSWIYFIIVIAILGVTSFFISKAVYYYDE